jgi:hypothetical protein
MSCPKSLLSESACLQPSFSGRRNRCGKVSPDMAEFALTQGYFEASPHAVVVTDGDGLFPRR